MSGPEYGFIQCNLIMVGAPNKLIMADHNPNTNGEQNRHWGEGSIRSNLKRHFANILAWRAREALNDYTV
ncbi:hypothetical protein GCM10011502_22770 [Oceanisphaera marina]|uniref:Uncharacterized protein n=1 Tax=Oceanisphaera marina TaxID=2017550 RepID=A0ABQ1IQ92_9GAMM|nr:hypothetical protein GCM10011502_22770 [Oceanisphaera marina]